MDTLDIYRGGNLLATIQPGSNAVQSKQIMGENVLRLDFEMSRYIDFTVGDTASVFGEVYKINQLPVIKKAGTYAFQYTITMEAVGADLAKAQFLFLNPSNSLLESDFSLMGDPATFMALLLQNASRLPSSSWQIGQVIAGPFKALSFSKENCYNALSRIAEAFDTEFWIEGTTIHLTKRRIDTALRFEVGRNRGLYEIVRTNFNNSSLCTILYASGSDKNLPADYRGGARRLTLPGGDVFVASLNGQINYGVLEGSEVFDDVYPQRTGKVTAVDPGNIYRFVDSTIDFDVNDQLLPGLTARLTFNTGNLAGYSFKVSSFDNATKTFVILKNDEERVLELPNASMKPAIGDQYVLTDIAMPQVYIDRAEEQLKARADALLEQLATPQLSYAVTIDPTYVKRYGITLVIGQEVMIADPHLNVERKIRIVKTTRNLLQETSYTVELSDLVTPGTLARIMAAQYEADRGIAQLQASVQNNALLNGNVIGSLNFQSLPTSAGGSGFSDLIVEDSTGKLYRKV
ncbi:hypothetical protein [Flaviaesturariibacter amylovorans]|uniref:Prophage tail endopeptidase domain-containing protein n=1 Tax=Flaviaesturariibacter amylovorans TaxID=1084520 RepID=A0ABP8GQW9_9BACT